MILLDKIAIFGEPVDEGALAQIQTCSKTAVQCAMMQSILLILPFMALVELWAVWKPKAKSTKEPAKLKESAK